ncbi:AMP-dependent synthetase/ligase [Nocardia miyunensis]|uniref:AMP-dependent synthetase/ligase n=1 Tax=Nocardia miyunensis TaxID=282684 RepID=UPI00082E6357|nr:AMP-binding protein [Nocardia miyunensis]
MSTQSTAPSTPSPATDSPLTAPTVPAAFQRTVRQYGERPALRSHADGFELTWAELGERVRAVAAGLAALGLRKGDTIAILLPNTVECHVIDYAATHLGLVPFAIFNSSAAEQIAYQVGNAGARIVVTGQQFLAKTQQAIAALGDKVEHLVVVDGDGGTRTLAELESSGDPAFDFEQTWRSVGVDDLATLIYTSGTTGQPKAALWSHRTVMAQQRALDAALPMPSEGIVSFLPMAHAGGRITAHYMALCYGATLHVCPDMRDLPKVLAAAHPDAFFSVPRMWEKLQVAIEGMVEANPDEAARQAGRAAIEIGLRRVSAADAGTDISAEVGDELAAEHARGIETLRPVLARLGLDRIKAAFIGGAPCTPDIVRFFRAVGVPLLEAYGATEVSLNVFNRVEDFKAGTAGRPLPGVEIKLGDDGELLARSDQNMVGYLNLPEQTAETIDAEGFVHTGDIAEIDELGFVSIVDRKKEIIINAAGKNMSPALIESAIKGDSSLLGQVVAVGDGKRYMTALITLDPEALPVYAKRLGLADSPVETLVDSPELRAEVQQVVDRGNERLNGNEQIKKFAVVGLAWAPDSEELTPTAKLKRRNIHAKYASLIEDLYADRAAK